MTKFKKSSARLFDTRFWQILIIMLVFVAASWLGTQLNLVNRNRAQLNDCFEQTDKVLSVLRQCADALKTHRPPTPSLPSHKHA